MIIVFSMFIDSSYENEYGNLMEPTLVMKYIKPVTVETVTEDYRDSINLFISVFFFGVILHLIIMLYYDKLHEVVQRSFNEIKKIVPIYSWLYLILWPIIFIFFRLIYTEDKFLETIDLYYSLFMFYFIIFFFLFLICTSYLFPSISLPSHDNLIASQNNNQSFNKLIKILILCSIIGLCALQFGIDIIKYNQSELFVCFIICAFWFVTYNVTFLTECNNHIFGDNGKRFLLDEPKVQLSGLDDVD